MDNNRINLELGLDFSAITEALIQIKSQFTGTEAEFKRISKNISKAFGEAEAAAKLFGVGSTQVIAANKRLEKSFIELGANGINYTSNSFKTLSNEASKAASTINNSSSTLKKGSSQWTNLALVVQDLPYGFRGIQNNLPALLGGIAGVGGAAYLAFSVIISGITMWDEKQRTAAANTKKLREETDAFSQSLKSAASGAYSEIASIKALISISTNHQLSMKNRLLAVKKLQDEYPAYFGNLSKEKILNNDISAAIDGVTVSLLAKAKASAIEGRIGELAAEDLIDSEKKNKLQEENIKLIDEKIKLQKIVDPGIKNELKRSEYIANNYGRIVSAESKLVKISNSLSSNTSEIDRLTIKTNESIKDQTRLQFNLNGLKQDSIGLEQVKPKAEKTPKAKKEKEDTFDLLKTTKEFYAAKLNFAEGDELAQKEILLREQETIDAFINNNQMSFNDYFNWSSEIYKQLTDLKIKEDKRFITESERIAKLQAKNVETQLGVQEKLHKNNLNQRIEDTKVAMAKLSVMAMMSLDPASMAVYLKMFDELNAKLQGLDSSALKGAEAMKKVNSIINDMASNSIILLGENIGKALGGESVDLFGGFIELMGSGLSDIGKALIAYGVAMDAFKKAFTNPFAAIAAGIGLVIAGSMLKSSIQKTSGESSTTVKAFANGGIISGPTMGLMGEYPGAQSNPEVVAPLDKLKDIIGGGGGGQFVLRGQDLLLSVNRAQKASNLKGQNISLA